MLPCASVFLWPRLHRKDTDTKLSRARSPVHAGVSHADPASRFASMFFRALTSAATARDHLEHSRGAVCSRVRLYPNRLLFRARAIPNFGRRRSRQSIEPKAVLEHRAPKISSPILHSRGVESKVGRAVHCAPALVIQTRPPGLESRRPRSYEPGYEPVVC